MLLSLKRFGVIAHPLRQQRLKSVIFLVFNKTLLAAFSCPRSCNLLMTSKVYLFKALIYGDLLLFRINYEADWQRLWINFEDFAIV